MARTVSDVESFKLAGLLASSGYALPVAASNANAALDSLAQRTLLVSVTETTVTSCDRFLGGAITAAAFLICKCGNLRALLYQAGAPELRPPDPLVSLLSPMQGQT